MLNTEVVQVSTGRTQKAGVTKSGRLIMWEVRRQGDPVSGWVGEKKAGLSPPDDGDREMSWLMPARK